MEKNGVAKTFLDRKIKVFPGGVQVNFAHSLIFIIELRYADFVPINVPYNGQSRDRIRFPPLLFWHS